MQEIEMELKNGLDQKEYTYLKNTVFKGIQDKKQTNHYFETNDFQLKKAGAALRIRYKNDQYISTLKEPWSEGLLETHDSLDTQTAKAWFSNDISLGPNIHKQLDQLGIKQHSLQYYGELTTYRLEKEEDDCLLVLDYSKYHQQEDFELEIEASSLVQAENMLNNLLTNAGIKRKEIPSKIKRFFAAKG